MPYSKSFKMLLSNLEENYLNKNVPIKYQKKYGKRYDLKDIKSYGYAIANTRGIKIDK